MGLEPGPGLHLPDVPVKSHHSPSESGRLTRQWRLETSSGGWRAPASSVLLSPQMYAMKSSLENMDAMELDFRMRLAEVQRQYKEKQRELVKLQRRRDSE